MYECHYRDNTHPHPSQHHAQAGGLASQFAARLLRDSNPPALLVESLLLLSHIARAGPRDANSSSGGGGGGGSGMAHDAISRGGVLPLLRRLLGHDDPGSCYCLCYLGETIRWNLVRQSGSHASPHVFAIRNLSVINAGVRARTANVVGNLCRHSGAFYGAIERAGLLPPLIERCSDPDRGARCALYMIHACVYVMTCVVSVHLKSMHTSAYSNRVERMSIQVHTLITCVDV